MVLTPVPCDDAVAFQLKGVVIMFNILRRLRTDESGVTAIEYGLIASLVAVVIIGAVTTLGTSLTGIFTTIAAAL